jgi:hypothetical protein
MAVDDPDWLKYVQLGISALTPIVTGVIGMLVLRMGSRLEDIKLLHQELLRKRLHLYEEVGPKLNDIHCFYQAIGHWMELNPEEVIERKRAIDRAVQVNRYLFRTDFWEVYQEFEKAHFEMFSGIGQPARLRLDMKHIKEHAGDLFKPEWMPFVSGKDGDHNEQRNHYHRLMEILGREVRGQ